MCLVVNAVQTIEYRFVVDPPVIETFSLLCVVRLVPALNGFENEIVYANNCAPVMCINMMMCARVAGRSPIFVASLKRRN